jgi:predicted PurR-regulated permease PerM
MTPEPISPPPRRLGRIYLARPLSIGFAATVGGLIAFALAGALNTLASVLVTIGVALFVAMALEPVVRWLELSRGAAIAVVFVGVALVVGLLMALVVPVAVTQVVELVTAFPGYIASLEDQDWFQRVISASGQADLYEQLLAQARQWLSNPNNLAILGGGALAIGTGLINGVSGGLIVLVLSLYFLGSMEQLKAAVVRLSPAYGRPQVTRVTNQLTESVGSYVSGMAILAFCNAILTFILLTAIGVPFAALLGAMALLVTMIPMIGSVLQWIIASLVALFTVGWLGLVFVIVYFAYMQVEAYVMTPRVMSKAVSVPGALVLIGAMAGAALLGLLGALIAVPVTASILMVINEVVVPRQDAKVDAEA